jgi:hypothetical protein
MTTFSERGYGIDWLKQTYLLGVDLTLDDGSPYPDIIFSTAIDQSARAVADELGLVFEPQTFRERHDKEPDQAPSWWPIRTRYRPIVSVSELNLLYGNSSTRAELPPEWANVPEPIAGQIHLVPTAEGSSSYLIIGGQPVLIGDLSQNAYVPSYFEVVYQAGFPVYSGTITIPAGQLSGSAPLGRDFLDVYDVELTAPAGISARVSEKSFNQISAAISSAQGADVAIDWKIDTLPKDIARAVALRASALVLNVAGDLIAGAGIASLSVSMDGLSQNLNTTSSATNSGYGARVLQFTKEYKDLISTLRAAYRPIQVAAL